MLYNCIFYDNNCYKTAEAANQIGIVVHSTGTNAPSLKRWCQPSKSDPNYDELIDLLGKNKNGNSWNRAGVKKCVHYIIGKLADGSVATMHTLPEEYCAWGVGSGKNGSYNYNPTAHIQFEVCEDGLTNETYFNAIYKEATELCADICKRHGWEANVIVSHKETYKKGYGSNHGDIDNWLKKFNLTMDDFRADVDKLLHPVEPIDIKVGEIVNFVGNKHYSNTNSASPKSCKPGEAGVKDIKKSGKHPYCLVRTSGSTSTVYGWVDAADIKKIEKKEEEVAVFAKGDKVKIADGATWYNGKSIPSWVRKKTLYVRDITKKNGKTLYVLSIYKTVPAYTGKVYADAIKKA